MPSRTRTPSDHHEIASALMALYTTMDSLTLLGEYDQIFLPPHPDHMFNAELALEAGFSQEAVEALQQMPYLSDRSVEFLPGTNALCWVEENPDIQSYRNEREMLPGIVDDLMPQSAIRLSNISTYGYMFIYDASTKLVHPWKPFDDSAAPDDYRQVAGKSAWEVFGPIISSYQRLENISDGEGDLYFFGPEGYVDDPNGPPFITDDMTEERREDMRKLREKTKAMWELRDVYLECGWNVEAEEPIQPTFQRDEFIRRRKEHLGLE